jgi:hypothetical protein
MFTYRRAALVRTVLCQRDAERPFGRRAGSRPVNQLCHKPEKLAFRDDQATGRGDLLPAQPVRDVVIPEASPAALPIAAAMCRWGVHRQRPLTVATGPLVFGG